MPRLITVCVLLALLLAPAVGARQSDDRLDELFQQLKTTTDPAEAHGAERRIWQIWTESGSATIDLLMMRGGEAMASHDFEAALAVLNQVVDLDPEFAEGWNRRATLYYMMGDFGASVADVQRTLALEPRHFGALSGLGLIYSALEKDELALKAFRAALEVNPHLPGARTAVKRLEELLGDKEI